LFAAVAVMASGRALADVFTPLASYEPSETSLVVTPNAGDAGLSVSIVQGSVSGAPPATDGAYVLRIDISGETDKKVEFRHDWTSSTYDLGGYDELLADVYIETPGAIPGLMGIWSTNWSPPSNFQAATGIPGVTGVWTTIVLDVSSRTQTGLNQIWAFIFENMAGSSGVAYVDNLRLRAIGGTPALPTGIAAVGYESRNEVFWRPTSDVGLEGYNVYRSESAVGPFVKLNSSPHLSASYIDPVDPNRPLLFYKVTAVVGGVESGLSSFGFAFYNGLTDDELLETVQEATLGYFWDYGHPHSGMAREGLGFGHPADTVTTGGTGMGLMTIVVGAERGFVTRAAAADRILRAVRFLDGVDPDDPNQPSGVQRYHGAWSHWMNGTTGATIAFAGAEDNGGDLVETAFLVEGLLTVRQFFDDPIDPVETEIRNRATSMWESVEWDWYRRFAGGDVLYWHWSPNFGWFLNHQIRGYMEAQIVYLLAVASPTHPMPATSYTNGWAGLSSYTNSNTYFGYRQWVGPALGGPLFFTHYSNLGFDPRYKRDADANYFENSRNISLINRAHCIDNPGGFEGYNPLCWGLTASANPWGYLAHSPTNDNGTITPTAAVSALPYTPDESLLAIRYLYDAFGESVFGSYGFYDAFNLGEDWFASGYLAIDEGPIAPMIENHRTGLCWKLFMSNPEIGPMMQSIGMLFEVDYDLDGDIDAADFAIAANCMAGPEVATLPPGCTQTQFDDADLDNDGDADMRDAAIFQELFTGP
jgi:hypothetical protein